MGARRNLFWKVVLILYLFYPVIRVIISIFVTSFNHSNYNPIDIIIKHIFVTTGNVPQWSTLSFPTWCARKQCQILRLKSKISLIRGKELDTKNSPEKRCLCGEKLMILIEYQERSCLLPNDTKASCEIIFILDSYWYYGLTDNRQVSRNIYRQVSRNIYIIIITH